MKIIISNGCNNNCSFCVVPFTKGKEKYKSFYNIIIEGYKKKKIKFLGQNVSSYCFNNKFFPKKIKFKKLIKTFNYKLFEVIKIDFITSNVKDFDIKTIRKIFTLKKISNLIHLPLQSGSNKILKKMNRKYNIKKYIYILKCIKKTNHNILFSTDIIINFFEKKKDFIKTIKILKLFHFDKIYYFNINFMKKTKLSYLSEKKKNTKLKFLFIKKILKNNILINSILLLNKKIKCTLIKKTGKYIYIFIAFNDRKIIVFSKKTIQKNQIYYSRILNFHKKKLFGIC